MGGKTSLVRFCLWRLSTLLSGVTCRIEEKLCPISLRSDYIPASLKENWPIPYNLTGKAEKLMLNSQYGKCSNQHPPCYHGGSYPRDIVSAYPAEMTRQDGI